jgi:putative membrane protein
MMYYGGAGGLGWIWMGFSMIAFWAVVITLVVWAVRSFSRDAQIKPPPSAALGILQERFAKGEISKEEYAQRSQVIGGAG